MAKRTKSAWFALYAEDYLVGTAPLSLAAQGAYMRLLAVQFDQGDLPADERQLCRCTGIMPDEWAEVRDEVLPKFEVTNGRMANARMAKERTERQENRQRCIDNGKKGGRPPSPKNPEVNPRVPSSLTQNGSQTEPTGKASTSTSTSTFSTESPPPEVSSETSSDSSAKRTKADQVEEILEAIWKASPPISRNRSGKAKVRREIDKHFKLLPPLPELLDRMKAWTRCLEWLKDGGEYIPGLHIWFSSGRWETKPAPAAAEAASSRFSDPNGRG